MENTSYVTYHINPQQQHQQQQQAFVVLNPSVLRSDMITGALTISEQDVMPVTRAKRGRKTHAHQQQHQQQLQQHHLTALPPGTIIAKELPVATTSRQGRLVTGRKHQQQNQHQIHHQQQPSVIAIANNSSQIVSQVVTSAGLPHGATATVINDHNSGQNIGTITIVKTAEERIYSLVKMSKILGRVGTLLLNKLIEVATLEQHSRNAETSGSGEPPTIIQVENISEVRNLPELFANDQSMIDLQVLIDYLRQMKNSTGEDLTFDIDEPFLVPGNGPQNAKSLFRCPHQGCMYSCMRNNALEKHIQAVHLMLKSFKCSICDQGFTSNAQLDRHLRQSHNEILQQTYFACDYEGCPSMFKNATNKRIHMRSVHEPRPEFSCEWPNCDFVGRNRSQIECHERKHTGMKPFICSNGECDKSFRTRDSMRRHELTHTMERRFICSWPGCGMKFKIARTLREHQARHSGINQVKCSYPGCLFETNYRHKLQSHEAQVHGKAKPYQCQHENCSKGFFNKQKYEIHQRIHMNERIFACIQQGCDKAFVEKGNMMKHYRNVHQGKGGEAAQTTTVLVTTQQHGNNIVNLPAGSIVNAEVVNADGTPANLPTVTVGNANNMAFNNVGGVADGTSTIAVVPAGTQFIH